MPEPKKPKQRCLSNSKPEDLRLVQPGTDRLASSTTENQSPGKGLEPKKGAAPQAELVEKLIYYIKSI